MSQAATVRSPFEVTAWSESLAVSGVDGFCAYAYIPDRTTIAVGISQKLERELNLEAVRADKVAIMRRASGGGAVVLARGVLCFGAIAPPSMMEEDDIRPSFRILTSHVIEVLNGLGVDTLVAGISDISARIGGGVFKLCGTAQLRKREAILVHGTMLVRADISLLEKYLAYPSEVPEYRAGRKHSDFCRNLDELVPGEPEPSMIAEKIREKALARNWRWLDVPDLSAMGENAQKLLAEKYLDDDWTVNRKRKK
ncbi:MAG: hypothetical protein JXR97_16990 [Planctomycetes bacterium]|nr:hypothetical protein [Planctomycetota bacterium]